MLIIFEKIVSMFLFSELVALRVEGVNFQGNQIDVRVHSFGNLLNIISIFYVLNNRIVRERSLCDYSGAL